VKAEGFTTPNGKSPWRGSIVVEAINARATKEKGLWLAAGAPERAPAPARVVRRLT
jgi:hypothetical protein